MKMSMLFDLSTPMQLHVNTLTIVFRVNNLTMILKTGPQICSSIIWEMVRNANSEPVSRPIESEALRVGPRHLCFNKPSG